MPLLTLVRHAKSSWDDPELDDFERSLNARGRRDAPLMAVKLRQKLPRAQRLISSPALRAITTARIFADEFGIGSTELVILPKIYEASPETLLGLLRELNDDDKHVMLFGHNPGFTQLSLLLAECPFDELPTCAAVHLRLNVPQWSEAAPACGELLQYLYPKDPAP